MDGEGDCFMIRASIQNRVDNQQGETLVEALVAILVSSLGMLMLASAISSGLNTINTSKKAINTYYASQDDLVNRRESIEGSNGTVTKDSVNISITATINDKPITTDSINVPAYHYTFANRTIALYEKVSTP